MKQALFKPYFFNTQTSLLRQRSLVQVPAFGIKVRARKVFNYDYINEVKDFEKKMTETRKKHLKEYWETQTQVENLYLERFRQERLEKRRRDMDRWRSSICNIAMHTKNQIRDLKKKEDELMRKLTEKDIRDTKQALENKLMLDVMEIESRKWPDLENLHQKVDENVILPQTILNYGEYQAKLQSLAFYAEQGDHESMQKLLDKEDIMEKKNLLLQPLFRDLKSMIKHMTVTEEYKLLKEYLDNRALILKNFDSKSKQAQEACRELELNYAKLLRNYKKQLQDPSKRLKVLQKRLEDIFQLLNIWTQYVEIIYMPETEINLIDTVNKLDARPDDTAYSFRAQELDVRNRLNILFGKEEGEQKQQKNDEESKERGQEFDSVNEGHTSDTTENTESMRRGQVEESLETIKTQENQKEEIQEGILSSEEEDSAAHLTERILKSSKVKFKPVQKEEIKSFAELNHENDVFSSLKSKEEAENKYNFADEDLEQFTAKLQSKAENEQAAASFLQDEDEETRFVKPTKYDKETIGNLDLENLNLFGVPLAQQETGKEGSSQSDTQKVLKNLLELSEELDNSDLSSFNIRKSFVYYDPYNPDETVTYAYLKFEDQLRLRASIVLDYYKQELKSIDEDKLTFADKERRQQVLKLLDYLGSLKIVDAQVLLRLYDLYRYKQYKGGNSNSTQKLEIEEKNQEQKPSTKKAAATKSKDAAQGKDQKQGEKQQKNIQPKSPMNRASKDDTKNTSTMDTSTVAQPKTKKVQFEDMSKDVISVRSSNEVDDSRVSEDAKIKEIIPLDSSRDQTSNIQQIEQMSLVGDREMSLINPNTEISQLQQNERKPEKKVLDHMVRVQIDLEPDEPCIVSYHYEYKDYLNEHNLQDPERAQYEQEVQNKKAKKQYEKEHQLAPLKENEVEMSDNEEQSLQDENSNPLPNCGKSKFDVLIKSLIARIEFNNCLAPIQEYGRHQQKGVTKKKKNKKKVPQEVLPEDECSKDQGPKYDDNYYDLDDDFIDDGDLEINQDEMVSEMLYDQSNAFSQTPGENQEESEKEEVEEPEDGEPAEDLDDEDDSEYLKYQERYNRLLKVFRVLPPDYVDEKLREKDAREQQIQAKKSNEAQQLTLPSMINSTKKPLQTSTNANTNASSNLQSSAEKQAKNTKKRDREEAFGNQKTDDYTIDDILNSLRQRVLNQETMNNFKREIQVLADLVEKKDPNWNEKLSQVVSMKLGQILQKSEQEMLYMLQRNCLLDKKKKKKIELDRIVQMTKSKIEFDLKNQNKKSQDDFVDLVTLDPNTCTYYVSEDLKNLLAQITKVVGEYVSTNAEYVNIKTLEEKAKTKKLKGESNQKLDQLNSKEEIDKIIQNLISGIPDSLKTLVQNKIDLGFQGKVDPPPPKPQSTKPVEVKPQQAPITPVNNFKQEDIEIQILIRNNNQTKAPPKSANKADVTMQEVSLPKKESSLVQVDNETLKAEYEYFKAISSKSTNEQMRESFIRELEKVFNDSDKKHDGKIDRKEFETLITGYFTLKDIKSTKENFDQYFEKLDIEHHHCITLQDFIRFVDQVNENDILPFLTEEMQNRDLF